MLALILVLAALVPSPQKKPQPADEPAAMKPSCVLNMAEPIRYLYSNTKKRGNQTLVLRGLDGSACADLLGRAEQSVRLRRQGEGIGAEVLGTFLDMGKFTDMFERGTILIDVADVEAPEGPATWTLEAPDGEKLGTVFLVVRSLEVEVARATAYKDRILGDVARDHGLVYGVDFIAAKVSELADTAYQAKTLLTISGRDLPAVDGTTSAYWTLSSSAIELDEAKHDDKHPPHGAQPEQHIQQALPEKDVEALRRHSDPGYEPVRLPSLVGIRTIGRVELENPVVETLSLIHVGKNKETIVLFRVPVELAKSIRRVRLPLPVGEFAYVACPAGRTGRYLMIAHDGGRHAVQNSSVSNKECSVVLSSDEVTATIARRHGLIVREWTKSKKMSKLLARHDRRKNKKQDWLMGRVEGRIGRLYGSVEDVKQSCAVKRKDELNWSEQCIDVSGGDQSKLEKLQQAYGSQAVVITVSKDGVKQPGSETAEVYVDTPSKIEKKVPFPDSAPDVDKPYEIVISSELDKERNGAGTASKLTLRPRGPFGFRNPLRVFLTIPLNLAALRFPASQQDTKSSTENPHVQVRTFDIGLLLSFEPWDYVRRQNMLPIPLRVSTGFLMTPTQRPLGFSFLAGGSFNIPLLEGIPQIDTSLSIGLFYEADLRQAQPFRDGSHFLMTFGFNIFSLFGAESAKLKK